MKEIEAKTALAIVLIVLAAIAARGALLYFSDYTADDSFITFRYAENLASGKGFVYNQGERVLGTSTPLYTMLLAVLVKLGLPIMLVARVINLAADCITGVLIFLLIRQLKFGAGFVAALLYVLFPRVVVWSVSGMETSLYVLFIACSLYFYHKEKFGLTSVFLGLTFLTRVDGIILWLALLLHFVLKRREFPVRMFLGSAAMVLPWLVFSFWYFGSPIPNSVPGKKALYSETMWETPQWRIVWEFLFLKVKIGWPLLVLALTGVYRVLTRARAYTFIVLWTALYLVFFFFAQTKIHIWYYVPFYLGYLILVALGAEWVFEKVGNIGPKGVSISSPGTNARLKMALLSVVIILGALVYFQQMRRTVRIVTAEQVALEGVHKNMGLWLRANTQAADTVCAEDIGYLGYYSGRYILDQDGLVSPQAIPFNRKKDRLGLLEEYRPGYFLIGLSGPYFAPVIESEWLARNYELKATFGSGSVRPEGAKVRLDDSDFHVCTYHIYKRIDLAFAHKGRRRLGPS